MSATERPPQPPEATIRAQDLDQLAVKLGRPPTGLTALARLTPDQVGLLSDAIDETRARHRRAVEQAFERAIRPALLRRLVLRTLRRRSL